VAAALVWLGCPDAVASQAIIRAEDPSTEDLHAFHEIWFELFGMCAEITVQQLHNATGNFEAPSGADSKATAETREALTELLGRIVKGRKDASTAIGQWLARHRGRVVGNHQLIKAATIAHAGSARWTWVALGDTPQATTKTRTASKTRPTSDAKPARAAQPKPTPAVAAAAPTHVPEFDGPVKGNGASHAAPAAENEQARYELFRTKLKVGEKTAKALAATFATLGALRDAPDAEYRKARVATENIAELRQRAVAACGGAP
jgi:hypothetical protein